MILVTTLGHHGSSTHRRLLLLHPSKVLWLSFSHHWLLHLRWWTNLQGIDIVRIVHGAEHDVQMCLPNTLLLKEILSLEMIKANLLTLLQKVFLLQLFEHVQFFIWVHFLV